MSVNRPTWQLVLSAADALTDGGHAEFSRAQLIDIVRALDPSRREGTIGPTIQGMTIGDQSGPRSACGQVLERVGRGRYRKAGATAAAASWPAPTADSQRPAPVADTGRRVGLVGCVKTKAPLRCAAKDLYRSPLFSGRRAYVERTCDEWWILSALLGLVRPDTLVDPYDLALKQVGADDRRRWAQVVVAGLDQLRLQPGDVVEFHAGSEYRHPDLIGAIERRGCRIENPVEGLAQGEQLRFYKEAGGSRYVRH